MRELAGATANAMSVEAKGDHETHEAATRRMSVDEAERILDSWPEAPKTAARQMLERYGAPNEGTPTKLFWYDRGPWKRVIVTRDVYTHHFPSLHSDYIMQTIDYKVPPERFSDVARFDGSCIPDRTAGEVTARCDSEWANILTLNLMHDIVAGKKNVEDARAAFGEAASAYVLGRASPYAERLQFEPPREGTEDVDEAVMAGPMAEQIVEKARDLLSGAR